MLCDGQLVLNDVGLSEYYGGAIAGLEIMRDGTLRIVTEDSA